MSSVAQLSDQDLLAHVQRAANDERSATTHLIALLMELDERRLYLATGCSSLFTYCGQVLLLSEHAAYGRIAAARAARQFPVILERLADGAINLTAIGLLAPHLTAANHVAVLDATRRKSKREVEELVARLHPRPDVPAVVRKLPERKPAPPTPVVPGTKERSEVGSPFVPGVPMPANRAAEIKPLAPERYKVQFTVDRETHEKLRRVQDLLRHTVPNGDPSVIFDRALTLLLGELERLKTAATERPRPVRPTPGTSRHVPAAVRRAVWARDGGRCAYVGTNGRCTETGLLEFHHVVPFAAGGETTSENISLRCRAHNVYEAERFFGPQHPTLLREPRESFGSATGSGPSCPYDLISDG